MLEEKKFKNPSQATIIYLFPPRPRASVNPPSPKPLISLSRPNPPSRPFKIPPRPSPSSRRPTSPRTPLSRRPTAAMIWNRGSESKPQRGFNFFFACGMSAMRLRPLSMVLTTVSVNSFSMSASWYSSGVASREEARALAVAAMRPSGSRARMDPLHSWRMRPPSSRRGLTAWTSFSSSSSSFGARSAFSRC